MTNLPSSISDAAAEFDKIPGIGPRAALRYVYWLVTQPKESLKRFAQALAALADNVKRCETCGTWSEQQVCSICANPARDASVLCVVATSQDLRVIEISGAFKGVYHVLGGLLDPISGRTPETLSIQKLKERLAAPDAKIKEVILAFDPDVSGDTTALYLTKHLSGLPITISRLARGLPTGAQLEYADSSTLADALKNRK
jgi:recombination protein RecR